MSKFLEIIPDHSTTDLDLNHYRSVGGYLDRNGDKQECAIMLDQRIVCKSSDQRDQVVGLLQELAHNVQDVEKASPSGVLTFMVFASLDDDKAARIYSRFESVHVMEAFLRRPEVGEFWQKSKSEIASMEARQYAPNGKGWLHRNGDTVETGKAI